MITALNISAPPAENELLRRPNQLLRTGRALLGDIVALGEREGVRVRSKAFVGPAKESGRFEQFFRSPAGVNDARAIPQDCCDRYVKCPTGDVLFDVVAHRTEVIGNNRLNPGKPFLLFRWYGCESTRFRARLFVHAGANASASWAPSVPLVSWAP